MDLALLVYGISLLEKVITFFGVVIFFGLIVSFVTAIFTLSWKFVGNEYSWNLNKDGSVKEPVMRGRLFGQKMFKWSIVISIFSAFILIALPSEKTAYMMVGAYATQKVTENEKVQETGKKVLTLIEQKLDNYIDEGIKSAERKVSKEIKGDKK